MAQESTVIEEGLDGTSFRNRVNEALVSVGTTYAGPTDPNEIPGITVEEGFQWIDTNTSPWLYKLYVPTASAAVAGWLTLWEIDPTTGAINPGATLQALLDGKLSLAGGTMTGAITLPGNPSGALEAAPKQYVDTVSRPAPIRFQIRGNAEVQNNVVQVLVSEDSQFNAVHMWADDAPVGSDLVIEVTRLRGVTTDSRSAEILDGTTSRVKSVTSLELVAGGRVRVDITGVGSTTPGGNDLLVTLPLTA